MKEIILKNSSNITQCAYSDDGLRVELGPYAVRSFKQEEAALLMADCGHAVREHVPMQMPELPGEEVWVANVSGSPFLPKTVRIKNYDRQTREWKDTQTPNLAREAQPFVGSFNLNQTPGGRNLGRRPVEVPAHYRMAVPKALADWMIARCFHTIPENRGIMTLCRAPTDFEPTMGWDLDDVIIYGMMMEPLFHTMYSVRSKSDLKQDPVAIEAETRRLLDLVFYYVVDPKYNLPTKTKFEAFKKRKIGEAQYAAAKVAQDAKKAVAPAAPVAPATNKLKSTKE